MGILFCEPGFCLAPNSWLSKVLAYETNFDINSPLLLKAMSGKGMENLTPEQIQELRELLKSQNLADPLLKMDEKAVLDASATVHADFERLNESLGKLGISSDEVLYLTMGNSMEAYNYVLKEQNPDKNFQHVKISRAALRNTSQEMIVDYFKQEITRAVGNNSKIKYTVIIDTFASGQSFDAMVSPLMKANLRINQMSAIIPACLFETGISEVGDKYKGVIDVVHPADLQRNFLKEINAFSNKKSEKMPVLSFSPYSTKEEIDLALQCLKGEADISSIGNKKVLALVENFKKSHLKYANQIGDRDLFVINGKGTGYLGILNPYTPSSNHKTVELVKNRFNQIISRDGVGSHTAQSEKVPEKLHQLNAIESFRTLSILDKMKLVILGDEALSAQAEQKVLGIIKSMSETEKNDTLSAFESYARSIIIASELSRYKSIIQSGQASDSLSLTGMNLNSKAA